MKIKKVLKIILIVILILIIIAIIYITRNYVIINKIASMQKDLIQKTNYSYIQEFYSLENETDKVVTEYYCKGAKRLEKSLSYLGWCDEDMKERIIVDTDKLTANVYRGEEKVNGLQTSIPISYSGMSTKEKIEEAVSTYITYENVNGEKCYKIKPLSGITSNLYYVNKENGTIVRVSMGHVKENSNIKITDYLKYQFDEATDREVGRPELTSYEVKYHEV